VRPRWEGSALVALGSGLVSIVATAIAVWLVYFVVVVAQRLDVWPF